MREIIIWGTGVIGRSLYYKILRGGIYKVKYFVDNSSINTFYNLEVYRPTKKNCSICLVVVASSVYYEEIAIQLTEFGLQELKDFIPYEALGKEVVLIHGNCHVEIIKRYLNTSKSFSDKYWTYPVPLIQDNKKGYIKDHLLNNCDVFIYQDIQEKNPFDKRLSANYLKNMVNGKKICIPNLYGLGKILFPQAEIGIHIKGDVWNNPKGTEIQGGLFNYRDKNIDNLWINGERNIREITKFLESEVYEADFIKQNFYEYIKKWEQREKLCDVKIVDYIKAEYRNIQLFWEPAHPCNILLKEISARILKLLDIDKSELKEIDFSFGVAEMPIYKCVINALQLNFEVESIRNTHPMKLAKLTEKEMDLEEYVREYCYWCFNEWKI